MEHLIFKTKKILELTNDQLFQLCADNKDLKIERNSNSDIIIMSPTGLLTGEYSGEIFRQIANWNFHNGLGKVFDSSTGFLLPDKSMLSPDAAWLSMEKYNKIPDKEKSKFPQVCPDFIVEIQSPSDTHKSLHSKMKDYMKNGCRMAWLICPEEEMVRVYHENDEATEIKGFNKIVDGGDVLPGFVLDLSLIKRK